MSEALDEAYARGRAEQREADLDWLREERRQFWLEANDYERGDATSRYIGGAAYSWTTYILDLLTGHTNFMHSEGADADATRAGCHACWRCERGMGEPGPHDADCATARQPA